MDGVTAKRIAFRCDASAVFGGGHAMRCLTLADAMAAKGTKIIFVTAVMPSTMVQRITEAGHKIAYIEASPELDRCGANWEAQPLSHEAQAADVKATGDVIGHSDWVVVDHYLLDAQWHSAARAFAEQVLVIDDLANRSYDCDILLDQTFGRTEEEYRTLVPSKSKVLAGASFALLRPEFARERGASLERRRVGGPVRRVFISMGTADPDGVTVRILDAILADDPEYVVDVVLGPQAASLDEVNAIAAQNPKVCVHVNSTRMAELARDADVAIGAAGMSALERCCLGLPSVIMCLAANQHANATALEGSGAAFVATSPAEASQQFAKFSNDDRVRVSAVKSAMQITDGQGADRVLEACGIESVEKGA